MTMYRSRMFRAAALCREVRSGLPRAAKPRTLPIISHLQRSSSLSHFVRNNFADVGAKNRIFSRYFSSSSPSTLSSSDILKQMQSSCEDGSLNPDLCETMLTGLHISRYTELRSKFPWLLASNSVACRQLAVNDLLENEMADIIEHPANQAVLDYTKVNIHNFSTNQVLNICRGYRFLIGESTNSCYQDLLAHVAQQIPKMDMECLSKFSLSKHENVSTCIVRKHLLETWIRFREIYNSVESHEEIRMVALVLKIYGGYGFRESIPVEELEDARIFLRNYVERVESTNDLDNMCIMFDHRDINALSICLSHWTEPSERWNLCLKKRVLDILSQDDLCLSVMCYMYHACRQTNTMDQFARKLTNYLQLNHAKLDIIALSRLGFCMPYLSDELQPLFLMIEEQVLLHMSKIERLLYVEQSGVNWMVWAIDSKRTTQKYVETVCQYVRDITIGTTWPAAIHGLFRSRPIPLPAEVYRKLLESISYLDWHDLLPLLRINFVNGRNRPIAEGLAKRILVVRICYKWF